MHQFYSIKRFLKHKLSFEIVILARRENFEYLDSL